MEIRQQAIKELEASDEDTDLIKHDYEKYIVNSVVNDLPLIYKDVIILRYFYDLSIGDIADQLGMSYQGVRKRLTTALRLLRKELDDE